MALVRALLAGVLLVALAACAQQDGQGSGSAAASSAEPTASTTPSSPQTASPSGSGVPSAEPTPEPTPAPTAEPAPVPEPRRSFMSVPALGLRDFPVVRYRGSPDDAPGTRIQNEGPMASPRGPRGGVGPGEVGNVIVTGHRTSHTAPLADLPGLAVGARILVRSGGPGVRLPGLRPRETSFRSAASLARQRAAVPGRPGVAPTQAMLTLSTCATPEDHAEGNYWSDEFGNPEHRIDKIAVLERVRSTG